MSTCICQMSKSYSPLIKRAALQSLLFSSYRYTSAVIALLDFVVFSHIMAIKVVRGCTLAYFSCPFKRDILTAAACNDKSVVPPIKATMRKKSITVSKKLK